MSSAGGRRERAFSCSSEHRNMTLESTDTPNESHHFVPVNNHLLVLMGSNRDANFSVLKNMYKGHITSMCDFRQS